MLVVQAIHNFIVALMRLKGAGNTLRWVVLVRSLLLSIVTFEVILRALGMILILSFLGDCSESSFVVLKL